MEGWTPSGKRVDRRRRQQADGRDKKNDDGMRIIDISIDEVTRSVHERFGEEAKKVGKVVDERREIMDIRRGRGNGKDASRRTRSEKRG